MQGEAKRTTRFSHRKRYGAMNLYDANNMMEMIPIRFYRYVDPYWPDTQPQLQEYIVTKETSCGYWIKQIHGNWNPFATVEYGKDKWIKKDADRPFAFDNTDDAYQSYHRRKMEHLRHLHNKERHIRDILSRMEGREVDYRTLRPSGMIHLQEKITFGEKVFKKAGYKNAWDREDFISETEMKVS